MFLGSELSEEYIDFTMMFFSAISFRVVELLQFLRMIPQKTGNWFEMVLCLKF